MNTLTTLAIETTCDDTALAIVRGTSSIDSQSSLSQNFWSFKVLCDQRSSQAALHNRTGGVVPEIAARSHVSALTPLLEASLQNSGLSFDDIDVISVANRPGLIPSLLVGTTFARALSYALDAPLVDVHHIEGHILSLLLADEAQHLQSRPFPWLVLTASGGHTFFTLVHDFGHYDIVGSTRDDAAGEAFDKAAKMLGLDYPGGPAIASWASKGNASAFSLPRPMATSGNADVSFSGLKTAFKLLLREHQIGPMNALEHPQLLADLCASYQAAIVETLTNKIQFLLDTHRVSALGLVGGVSANTELRRAVQSLAHSFSIPLFTTPLAYTGDNAAMIGVAGLLKYFTSSPAQEAAPTLWETLTASARSPLERWS